MKLLGNDMTNRSPLELIRSGVAHIPQDRASVGAVGDLSVAMNLAMKHYREPPLAKGFFLSPRRIMEFAQEQIARYTITTPSPQTPIKFLSGGNIQKTILAREISAAKTLMVAVYPSRGLECWCHRNSPTPSYRIARCGVGSAPFF